MLKYGIYLFAFCLFFALPLESYAHTACPLSMEPAVHLFSLIEKREQLMKSVATFKFHCRNQPTCPKIYSPIQEIKILTHAKNNAQKHQLNVVSLQVFTQMLMDMSKQIEVYWFHKKHLTGNIKLKALRHDIVTIDKEMIPALVRAMPVLKQSQCYQQLQETIVQLISVPDMDNNYYQSMLLYTLVNIKKDNESDL